MCSALRFFLECCSCNSSEREELEFGRVLLGLRVECDSESCSAAPASSSSSAAAAVVAAESLLSAAPNGGLEPDTAPPLPLSTALLRTLAPPPPLLLSTAEPVAAPAPAPAPALLFEPAVLLAASAGNMDLPLFAALLPPLPLLLLL